MLFDIVEENHSELDIFSYFASRPRGFEQRAHLAAISTQH
jgi:hypothetical protein